ncbi:pyridoxamine 5'-phosphate oxidase family protein [Acidobacteria bacterium AB60]|nr:pyridoxamine 5'-phosphate oxidase family protein [Acidobacteria bacterium AB60]
MAKQFERMDATHREFITRQKIFFNASAAAEGHVNLSPRDGKSLRVLDDETVLYLDLTGSGNETAAHLRANGRLTLMFCAFEGAPMILRLYGTGRVVRRGCEEYAELLARHYEGAEPLGARQMVVLTVQLVQTSCGYNVPKFEYGGERDTLLRWAEKKGPEGLEAYWREKNQRSLDGFPTGLLEEGRP